MYSSESVAQVLLADGRDPTDLWVDFGPLGDGISVFSVHEGGVLVLCSRGGGGLHSDRNEIERYVTVG